MRYQLTAATRSSTVARSCSSSKAMTVLTKSESTAMGGSFTQVWLGTSSNEPWPGRSRPVQKVGFAPGNGNAVAHAGLEREDHH